MTSTNDGKDVKSNQTSGQKGKKYYIALFQSLEAHLSGQCSTEERTQYVCEAWRLVHSLCLQSTATTHPHLLSWVQRHTAHAILLDEWGLPENKIQHVKLEEAINAFILECHNEAASPVWEAPLLRRALWFKSIISNPWGHSVLKSLLDPKGKQPTDEEVIEWLREERGMMFVTRLRVMARAKRLIDLALVLATAIMARARRVTPLQSDVDQADVTAGVPPERTSKEPTFVDILSKEAGFTKEVWELLTDIEFVLLHKLDHSTCIDLAKKIPLKDGEKLVERLRNRLEKSPADKKLWKKAKDVAILIAQVVVTRCMVVARCAGGVRAALVSCAAALAQLLPAARLPSAADAMAKPAASAAHLYAFADAIFHKCKDERKPFVCELYVRAITAGMNELERLKLEKEKEGAAHGLQQTLSEWFSRLGEVVAGSARLRCECLLTAFSVHPSAHMYERVCALPPLAPPSPTKQDTSEPNGENNSEYGSWASDSRTRTNFVKTSETLNLKQTQKHANILSSSIFDTECEALGLSSELCEDLAVLLSGPRVKTLSWDMDREALLENCRMYMERTHEGTRALTMELKYLNLDPHSYDHLPEEADDENDNYGIEKGYEQELDFEDIWSDNIIDYPERCDSVCSGSTTDSAYTIIPRQKNRKSHSKYFEEERDPLWSETENNDDIEVNIEKSKKSVQNVIKETQSEGSKKKQKQKCQDNKEPKHLTESDKEKELRKKQKRKERRERKKKEKLEKLQQEEQISPMGALSRIIGIKASGVPDIRQEIERRKKENMMRAQPGCVTDSDYDSQGKSSLASANSEGNDPNVLYDGLFSMDEIKSPEKSTPNVIIKTNENKTNLNVSNVLNLNHSTDSKNLQFRPVPDVIKDKLQFLDDNKMGHTNNSINFEQSSEQRELVKKNLKKLLQYRQQKNFVEQQRNRQEALKHNKNIVPNKEVNNIYRSETQRSQPLNTGIPGTSQIVGNIKQVERLNNKSVASVDSKSLEILNSCENSRESTPSNKDVLHCDKSNVKKTYSKNVLSVNTSKKKDDTPSQKQYKAFLNTQAFRTSDLLHETPILSDPNQKQYHEFLKQQNIHVPIKTIVPSPVTCIQKEQPKTSNAQRSLNNQKSAESSNLIKPNKTQCFPDSQLGQSVKGVPVLNYNSFLKDFHKKSCSSNSQQTVKLDQQTLPTVETKHLKHQKRRVENVPNTFSRLSYMHKNKQADMKSKQTNEQAHKDVISNTVTSQVYKSPDDAAFEKINNLQSKGEIVISKTQLNYRRMHSASPQIIVKQGERLNYPSTSANVHTNTHLQKFNVVNISKSTNEVTENKLKIQNDPKSQTPINLQYLIQQQSNLDMCNKWKGQYANTRIERKTPSIPISVCNLYKDDKVVMLGVTNKEQVTHKTAPLQKSNKIIISEPKPTQLNTKDNIKISQQQQDGENTNSEDWKLVMNAIRALKTPNRGMDGLEMSMEKDSADIWNSRTMSNLPNSISNSIINTEKVHSKDHSTTMYSKNPTVTNILDSKQVVLTNELQQKQELKVIKKASKNSALQVSEEQPKLFTSKSIKASNPTITSMLNSDYDQLDDLIDDDLRQEIEESSPLNSEEDAYRSVATTTVITKNEQFPANISRTKEVKTVQINNMNNHSAQTSSSRPIQHTQALPNSINPTSSVIKENSNGSSILKPKLHIISDKLLNPYPNTQFTKTETFNPENNTCNLGANHTTIVSEIPLAATTQIRVCNISNNVNVIASPISIVHPANVVIQSRSHINQVQNVMLISATNNKPSSNPTATIRNQQVPLISNAPKVAVNVLKAPNISLFNSTQFTVPVVNPIIIGNAVANITPNQSPVSSDKSKSTKDIQQCVDETSKPNIKSELEKVKTAEEVIDKCHQDEISNKPLEPKVNSALLSNPCVTENKQSESSIITTSTKLMSNNISDSSQTPNKPHTPLNVCIPENKSTDSNIESILNKFCERKVLSQVQENQLVATEIIENKKIFKIKRSPSPLAKKQTEKDIERLRKKRLSIIHREINHYIQSEPIALSYAPIQHMNKIANEQTDQILSIEKDAIHKPELKLKLVIGTKTDTNLGIIKHKTLDSERFKENNKSTHCRRLRSSNASRISSYCSIDDTELSKSNSDQSLNFNNTIEEEKTTSKRNSETDLSMDSSNAKIQKSKVHKICNSKNNKQTLSFEEKNKGEENQINSKIHINRKNIIKPTLVKNVSSETLKHEIKSNLKPVNSDVKNNKDTVKINSVCEQNKAHSDKVEEVINLCNDNNDTKQVSYIKTVCLNEKPKNSTFKSSIMLNKNNENISGANHENNVIEVKELRMLSDKSKKVLRLKLSNGKVFRATVSGHLKVDLNTILSEPAIKSLLLQNNSDIRTCTLNVKQIYQPNNPQRPVSITTCVKESAPAEAEVIDLISDDEDENIFIFETEFGNFKIKSVDSETYVKHQAKFKEKCIVKLENCNILKNIVKIYEKTRGNDESTSNDCINDLLQSNMSMHDMTQLNDSTNEHDSPNDTNPLNSEPVNVTKDCEIDTEKIFQMSACENITLPLLENKKCPISFANSLNSEPVNVTKDCEIDTEKISQISACENITLPLLENKKCPLSFAKCDELVKTNIQLKKICTVNLVRCDDKSKNKDYSIVTKDISMDSKSMHDNKEDCDVPIVRSNSLSILTDFTSCEEDLGGPESPSLIENGWPQLNKTECNDLNKLFSLSLTESSCNSDWLCTKPILHNLETMKQECINTVYNFIINCDSAYQDTSTDCDSDLDVINSCENKSETQNICLHEHELLYVPSLFNIVLKFITNNLDVLERYKIQKNEKANAFDSPTHRLKRKHNVSSYKGYKILKTSSDLQVHKGHAFCNTNRDDKIRKIDQPIYDNEVHCESDVTVKIDGSKNTNNLDNTLKSTDIKITESTSDSTKSLNINEFLSHINLESNDCDMEQAATDNGVLCNSVEPVEVNISKNVNNSEKSLNSADITIIESTYDLTQSFTKNETHKELEDKICNTEQFASNNEYNVPNDPEVLSKIDNSKKTIADNETFYDTNVEDKITNSMQVANSNIHPDSGAKVEIDSINENNFGNSLINANSAVIEHAPDVTQIDTTNKICHPVQAATDHQVSLEIDTSKSMNDSESTDCTSSSSLNETKIEGKYSTGIKNDVDINNCEDSKKTCNSVMDNDKVDTSLSTSDSRKDQSDNENSVEEIESFCNESGEQTNYSISTNQTNISLVDPNPKFFHESDEGTGIPKLSLISNEEGLIDAVVNKSAMSESKTTLTDCEKSELDEALNKSDLILKENENVSNSCENQGNDNNNDSTVNNMSNNDLFQIETCDYKNDITDSNKINNKSPNESITLVYKGDSDVVLKGSVYEDPIVGTCYIFPLSNKNYNREGLCNNICDDKTIAMIKSFKKIAFDERDDSAEKSSFVLKIPKVTYSRHVSKQKKKALSGNKRNLKRKIDSCNDCRLEKKYRKGKNIDYPKQTSKTAYIEEYKRVLEYCTSIKFSYSRPFHKEYIDISSLLEKWPIKGNPCDNTVSLKENENLIFLDPDDERKELLDPLQQTLAQEIAFEYKDRDENSQPDDQIEVLNFNMGFGEGSDRVIQDLENGSTTPKLSAATLSDVKLSQPFFTTEDKDSVISQSILKSTNEQLAIVKRCISFIELRDKVRSFFRKTAIELQRNLYTKDKGYTKQSSVIPYDLISSEFFEPAPQETIVHVVQVGQLPVSASAQNPVTCDPRVTQVSNASPPQCSEENSHDDSQSATKTEYTELTTAELRLPLVQEYEQNSQVIMSSQSELNSPIESKISNDVNCDPKVEIKDEVEVKSENAEENNDIETFNDNNVNNVSYSYKTENNHTLLDAESQNAIFDSLLKQENTEYASTQKAPNGTSEKTDQIAHAMNAAGITTSSETVNNTRAHALVNILSQKMRQNTVTTTQATVNYTKGTPINAMALQQALAQILPPPLNQTNSSESPSAPITPQVLHIVQGKNTSGNQITIVDNNQQNSVINNANNTPVLHIVQNKSAMSGSTSNSSTATQHSNSFSGLSLVDAGLQQGGNQLLHIVNTGSQKNNTSGQLLKRVNLLTNLTNVQGTNEQKMVQFVCKSADGKSIQLNAPHQRSMVLRLQPIESPNVSNTPKSEGQELSPSPNFVSTNSTKESNNAQQQEIKSRSVYEENYAKFIQNSSTKPMPEKSTSLPKFNQAFGKQVFQDNNQKTNEITSNTSSHLSTANNSAENVECPSTDSAINLEHINQINSPPLLLRKSPAQTTQSQQVQSNLVQQIKQTIAPMNIQTMHGGVIYTRQIPVNIGGGQTINLITVPSTDLIDENGQKQQGDVKFVNQNEIEPSIIKIVPQNQSNSSSEVATEENNTLGVSNDMPHTNHPTHAQPVLTQMRIKLPMLSKTPQMVSGARVVRPSFFQIQRNVIGGANQPVYQQLVLTAAPSLGQQQIRLPQAQTNRQVKTTTDSQSSSESQMSTSTLEQLREFDMVLEQVKERSTVQPNSSSNNTFSKLQTQDTTDGNTPISVITTEPTQQVLYSIGNNHSLNVAYVNRKPTVPAPTTSTFVRSPDSSGVADSPTSSTHAQMPLNPSNETSNETSPQQSQPKSKSSSKSKSRPKTSSNPPNSLKINTVPPKTSTQKPLEDEQTTQRILYILAEYKEQVENSPDKDKPAPRRRSNPPSNPGSSKRKKSSSGSRRPGGRDMSPVHGDDTCRTMGSEDSSCGTSQGDCTENCLESHSPQDSPRKVVRKLTFENETPNSTPRQQPARNVIVADGQTITVARGTAGKPATAVLMPANYILPVSMVKGGQQIAIVTNRGPKILTVGGEGGATNALLLQRLIGPAGLKPVLARPGVRHVRLPTAALHNLQAFNLATTATVQPPDSTASPAPAPTPPDLVETRATSSPWPDRESQDVKPERGSSPEGSEPWNLPSSADPHDYSYEETVRAENLDRTVLDAIPDRYSPDTEAQRIFDKMFDVDTKKSFIIDSQDDSPRCGYDIDASDCDDKSYQQVVQKRDQRQHRLAHVSAAALRHKYAILEHELRLQKSLSEECEDLGVDSPSAAELFPEAELLFAASPAHDNSHHAHTPQPGLSQSSIPQPDMDDQIATDQLLTREHIHDDQQDLDVTLGLDEGIVTVSEDGMQATIALDQEEFARSHPNTTFHSEPTEEENVQPYTISGIKGRHITSTIFHAGRAPATVLMTAPQTTVISQAMPDNQHSNIKYIDNIMNSGVHNNICLSSVLVKDDGLTKYDNILNDSRELHLSNTASAIVHSNATQVIRRVCYDDEKRDSRFLLDETDALIAGDDAKMIAEDSSRDATLESIADDRSSPERHTELFWESNSASERSDSRRPLDFSSDSDKCCKSPLYDETNSTDSSGVGTHMRLDSVIKDARGLERSGSADNSSADDTLPPLRTYPPKRMYHIDGDMERSVSGKTRAGERSPDGHEVRRRASVRGVVKRGCHCCNGSPAPPRPKKSRQKKPSIDFSNN